MNPEGSLLPGVTSFAITPRDEADEDGPNYAHGALLLKWKQSLLGAT
jgi:hypothetical protein